MRQALCCASKVQRKQDVVLALQKLMVEWEVQTDKYKTVCKKSVKDLHLAPPPAAEGSQGQLY